jgi:hypothetical protein
MSGQKKGGTADGRGVGICRETANLLATLTCTSHMYFPLQTEASGLLASFS